MTPVRTELPGASIFFETPQAETSRFSGQDLRQGEILYAFMAATSIRPVMENRLPLTAKYLDFNRILADASATRRLNEVKEVSGTLGGTKEAYSKDTILPWFGSRWPEAKGKNME